MNVVYVAFCTFMAISRQGGGGGSPESRLCPTYYLESTRCRPNDVGLMLGQRLVFAAYQSITLSAELI